METNDSEKRKKRDGAAEKTKEGERERRFDLGGRGGENLGEEEKKTETFLLSLSF